MTSSHKPSGSQSEGHIDPSDVSSSPVSERAIVLDDVERNLRQLLLDVAGFIEKTPTKGHDTAIPIPDELKSEPLVLRFTGGWVRDKLLRQSSQDIDVAINKMTGEQFGLRLKEYLESPGNAEKYGIHDVRNKAGSLSKIEANPEKSKHLETVTTKLLGLDVDLVNLRKETYSEESRNPVMEFGSPEEDALRRDATINAMFYNLHSSRIEDFTCRGLEDLQAGIIRTPLEPYTTFKDDPLRVLRLIRFASRLGYQIEHEAQKAMQHEDIKKALLLKITKERIWTELEKMLKGPDPHQALKYIDSFHLYTTIFIDPHSESAWVPALDAWHAAYDALNLLLGSEEDVHKFIRTTLIRNSDDKFAAWMIAALIPWTEAPQPPPLKNGKRAPSMSSTVAREGIKAPNKITDLLATCVLHLSPIMDFVQRNVKERDVLGMALREWGSTWRLQALHALLFEIYKSSEQLSEITSKYARFLRTIETLDLFNAPEMQPIINGKDLQKALDTSAGPWMKPALNIIMSWQLRNPGINDPTEAIEAVKASDVLSIGKPSASQKAPDRQPVEEVKQGDISTKGFHGRRDRQKRKGELTYALVQHFLRDVLKPIFAQVRNPEVTAAGRRKIGEQPKRRFMDESVFQSEDTKPWKHDKGWVLNLLLWTTKVLSSDMLLSYEPKAVEKQWSALIPPILTILDDTDVHTRTKGCQMLQHLLSATSPALLTRTGLAPLFKDSLMASTTYIPTLTPESASVTILSAAYPALVQLANTWHPPPARGSPPSAARIKLLDEILRKGILFTAAHTADHSSLSATLLRQLAPITAAEGIDSVRHLKDTLPLVGRRLADPFAPAHPDLLAAACEALRALLLNAWPRVAFWRAEVLKGLGLAWLNLADERSGPTRERVETELRQSVRVLAAAEVKAGSAAELRRDARRMVEVEGALKGLFEELLDGADAERRL